MASRERKPIPQGVRFDVFRRDNFACVYCGRGSPDVTLHCDHKVAHSRGGSDDPSNLVTACSDCNYGKSAKTVKITRSTRQAANDNGLVGLFGHRMDEDGDIANQFEVSGVIDAGLVIIHLMSFLDGCRTTTEIIPAIDLTSKEYKLYPSASAMRLAYWKDKERRGLLRGKTAEEAYQTGEWFSRVISGAAA